MKRIRRAALWVTALALCLGVSAYAAAEEAYAAHAFLNTAAYGVGEAELAVLAATEDPGRAGMGEEDIAAEIRFFPFDAESGLYGAAGEPAGERAEILSVAEDGKTYTVRLRTAGKYTLSGTPYYLLDPAVPALTELRAELDEAVARNTAGTEKDTAAKLHDWLCGRVSASLPGDRADPAAYEDPFNALLSGCAARDAYAPLYRILLGAAGIRSIVVSGKTGGQDTVWNLCRLDGTWSWTDCAMDDLKDRQRKKYLQADDKTMAADHVPAAAEQAFVEHLVRQITVDLMAEGALPFEPEKVSENSDDALMLVYYDGPAVVVGESAAVTWHVIRNYDEPCPDAAGAIRTGMLYFSWLEKEKYYAGTEGIAPVPEETPADLFTVEAAAEDMSTFTVTFHRPGMYSLYNMMPFYLISPEQKDLAALAEQISRAVKKASGRTEKETASNIMNWLCGKLAYDYSYGATDRAMAADYEPMAALLYGKSVCEGYAETYRMLLKQAGIRAFLIHGVSRGDGHTWNLCRYDGIWYHSDPTWCDAQMKYFAMTSAQISRDHDMFRPRIYEQLFFTDPLSLWTAQFLAEYGAGGAH